MIAAFHATMVVPQVAAAQEPPADVTVQALWSAEQFLSSRATLEFALSRRLEQPRERLGVLVGTVDVSAMLELRGTTARFRPAGMRLPAGQSEVIAYIISDTGEWREVGRYPLNVRTALGLDQGRIQPNADVSSNGQLDQNVPDGAPPPERRTYQDVTFRFGVEGAFARDGWQFITQANTLGVTRETQRLRWYELQANAPAVDLSDYRVQLSRGPVQLALGNVTIGGNRFLLAGFGSRGVSGGVRLGSVASFEAAIANGTNVVGWSNPFGLAESSHRMHSLSLGLELMPSRPGALHIDVSGFDGSVLPVSSFNQGSATDAEESRGVGVQLAMSTASQRIRFAGGFARSQFENPIDPLLSRDTTLVIVTSTTRMARYGELGVQLLQGLALSPNLLANLGATARHERVDPLYRSVGAPVQSDIESNGVELSGSIGPVSLQAMLSATRDNLRSIASILTTRTRTRGVNGVLPLGALLGQDAAAGFLPNLSAGWQRVHQAGDGVPVNGDFAASHVPDQISTNQTARADWMRGTWSFSYAWNRSHQDNRQTGRENSDFRTTVHAVSLALTPGTRITTSIDLSIERQKNFELNNTQRVERLGTSGQFQLTSRTALSGSLSQSWGFDPFAEQRTRNMEYHVELSQGFNVYARPEGGTQGRVFIRYARTRAAFLPFDTPSLVAPQILWTLNAGASFRLY